MNLGTGKRFFDFTLFDFTLNVSAPWREMRKGRQALSATAGGHHFHAFKIGAKSEALAVEVCRRLCITHEWREAKMNKTRDRGGIRPGRGGPRQPFCRASLLLRPRRDARANSRMAATGIATLSQLAAAAAFPRDRRLEPLAANGGDGSTGCSPGVLRRRPGRLPPSAKQGCERRRFG